MNEPDDENTQHYPRERPAIIEQMARRLAEQDAWIARLSGLLREAWEVIETNDPKQAILCKIRDAIQPNA